jgi:hypothetical protein
MNLNEIFNAFKLIESSKVILTLTYTKFNEYLINKYELNTQNDVLNVNINPQWYIENKSGDITQHIIVFNSLYNTIVFDFKNNKELFRSKVDKPNEIIEFIVKYFTL